VRMFLGLTRAHLGRMSEGLTDFEQAAVFASRNGDRFWHPRLVSQQGWLHRELASMDKAAELDGRSLALARDNPSRWTPEIDALLNLCIDGVRSGGSERASDLLAVVEDGIRTREWFRWMSELRLEAAAAEHFCVRKAFDAMESRVARLATLASRVGARSYVCTAARLRAEGALAGHGNVADALARLQAALDSLRALPAPLETWKSRRALGLMALRLGSRRSAKAAFEAAADDIETIVRGTDQSALRASFLCSPPVRDVLIQAGRVESASLSAG
jgi:hypothetical protein